MPRQEPDPVVTLSVLDRLIDNEPHAGSEPLPNRAQSLRQFKAALRRDLEWLLNSRRNPEPVDDTAAEVYRSVYNYGLPDISNLSTRATEDRNRLVRIMERSIALFEPRLRGITVALEGSSSTDRTLRFVVEGMLMVDPAPERVSFDATLEVTNHEYAVKGD